MKAAPPVLCDWLVLLCGAPEWTEGDNKDEKDGAGEGDADDETDTADELGVLMRLPVCSGITPPPPTTALPLVCT